MAFCFPLKIFCLINPPDIQPAEYLAFKKDSFVEISRTKQAESIICMVCFQQDPILSGVKGFLSRGVLSGSHV